MKDNDGFDLGCAWETVSWKTNHQTTHWANEVIRAKISSDRSVMIVCSGSVMVTILQYAGQQRSHWWHHIIMYQYLDQIKMQHQSILSACGCPAQLATLLSLRVWILILIVIVWWLILIGLCPQLWALQAWHWEQATSAAEWLWDNVSWHFTLNIFFCVTTGM